MTPKKVLVIAPHPDDAELGCGASIAKWAEAGADVMILMLSDRGEGDWMMEAREAAAKLGEIQVETAHLTVFQMHHERQSLLRILEEYRGELTPDLVLAPAAWDRHQDHQVAMDETRRVFRDVTLLGYEITRSNRRFMPTVFVPVDGSYVRAKAFAVSCYTTQRGKLYAGEEAITGLAAVRGAMCGVNWAEAFEMEHSVWR